MAVGNIPKSGQSRWGEKTSTTNSPGAPAPKRPEKPTTEEWPVALRAIAVDYNQSRAASTNAPRNADIRSALDELLKRADDFLSLATILDEASIAAITDARMPLGTYDFDRALDSFEQMRD